MVLYGYDVSLEEVAVDERKCIFEFAAYYALTEEVSDEVSKNPTKLTSIHTSPNLSLHLFARSSTKPPIMCVMCFRRRCSPPLSRVIFVNCISILNLDNKYNSTHYIQHILYIFYICKIDHIFHIYSNCSHLWHLSYLQMAWQTYPVYTPSSAEPVDIPGSESG